jgi:5-oxoprolinase (ATP-hydrolysing)
MPPDSKTVDEEGILIDNDCWWMRAASCEAEMRALLGSGRWPARDPDRNIADLKAQVAACTRGANELRRIAAEYGREVIDAYMGHVMDNAERRCAGWSAALRTAVHLCDGQWRARFRFGEGGPREPLGDRRFHRHERSAAEQFQRALFHLPSGDFVRLPHPGRRHDPMNDGCLRPIELIVPEGSMLRPRYPAAVVAGNVETSQVVTDVLFAACERLRPARAR